MYLQYIYVDTYIALFAVRFLISCFCCFQIRRQKTKNEIADLEISDFILLIRLL